MMVPVISRFLPPGLPVAGLVETDRVHAARRVVEPSRYHWLVAGTDCRHRSEPALPWSRCRLASDDCQRNRDVRFTSTNRHPERGVSGPIRTLRCYSITSSAVASIAGGTVMPRALAVLRLITSSNLVGCSMGRSPGLVPRKILST
jgi:hypothetical protein